MLLSEYLKEKTAPLHDLTEAKFQSNRIFEKSYTKSQYQRLILGNYYLLDNFEKAVFEFLPEDLATRINLLERSKLPALQKDVACFQGDKNSGQSAEKIENLAQAFGMLYVMEGSTLGGNVIAKQLSRNPEFEGTSFHYFGIYGEKTGEMWKNFKEILDSQFSDDDFPEVLKGAEKAYNFLLNS